MKFGTKRILLAEKAGIIPPNSSVLIISEWLVSLVKWKLTKFKIECKEAWLVAFMIFNIPIF